MVLSKSNESNTGYDNVSLMGAPVRTHVMCFSEEVQQYIIQQLTDLYSNPVIATVRETVSNALDATALAIAQGEDPAPVEVFAPSAFDQVFKVVDHGVGMTAEQLDEFFSDYGNSSKIEDMSAIGSKGLGAKAPLAYTQTFNVETVHDGRRIVISLNRGATANETKTLVDEPTSKPNGTTVTVPVRREDVQEFEDAVRVYEKYSTPDLPIVVDGKARSLADRYVKLGDYQIAETADGEPVLAGLWAYRGEDGQSLYDTARSWIFKAEWGGSVSDSTVATLGGWCYSLSSSKYYRSVPDDPDFVVELKPGVVDFPASRDEIKVNDRFDEFTKYVSTALQFNLHGTGRHADAEKLWGSLTDSSDRMAVLNALILTDSNATWTNNVNVTWSRLLTNWPEETALFKVNAKARKFRNVADYAWSTNRGGARVVTPFMAMGRCLGKISEGDATYVNWGWRQASSADEFISMMTTTDAVEFAEHKSHAYSLKLVSGKAVEDLAKDPAAATAAIDVLRQPSVDWMKTNPCLKVFDDSHSSSQYRGMIVIADNDYSKYGKKLGWLRAYTRLCVGNGGGNRGHLYALMFEGKLSKNDADSLEKAASNAGVSWIGVMDWDAVKTAVREARAVAKPVSETASAPAQRRLGATVKATKLSFEGLSRCEAIRKVATEGWKYGSTGDKVDLSKAVADGALVYITCDSESGYCYRQLRLASWLLSLDDFTDRDLYIIKADVEFATANALKPVAEYEYAAIGREDARLSSLKTVADVKRVKAASRKERAVEILRDLITSDEELAHEYAGVFAWFYLSFNCEYAMRAAAASKSLTVRLDALLGGKGQKMVNEFRNVFYLDMIDCGNLPVPDVFNEGSNEYAKTVSKLLRDMAKLDSQIRSTPDSDFTGRLLHCALDNMRGFDDAARKAGDDDPAIKFISQWVDGLLALPAVQID